jgi:hypothetical protein
VNAVANDQAEKVGAGDSEDASDGRADKPLQADASQPEFKQNYCNSAEYSSARCRPSVQPKGMQFVACNCCNENE